MMNTRRLTLSSIVVCSLALTMLACSLSGVGPQTASTPSVAAVLPTSAATAEATEAATPEPTAMPLGPAVSHFASGQKIIITYIHMVSAKVGWAIGGQAQASDHVFRSQDGGQTWQDVTPPEPSPASGDEIQATGFFKDSSSAWVVYAPGSGAPAPASVRIWNTHDAGASWQYSSLNTSDFQEFFNPAIMTFVDDQHGWFLAHVGAGMNHDIIAIAATTDGGRTWRVANDLVNDASGLQSCEKNGMAFADAQNGWLTLDCNGVDPVPHLYKTSDGGANWQRVDLAAPAGTSDLFTNFTCGMYSPVLSSPQAGVFSMKCVDNANSKTEQDFLYWTSNGGAGWQTAEYPGGSLIFFGQQGLALGQTLSVTADGGHTWTPKMSVTWSGQFSFIDADRGWVVATNQGAIAFLKTEDGAASWQTIRPVVAP